MSYKIERLQTDVLIVGGGIAGAMAAIQAREHDADVLVLEAANTYRSGNAGSGIDHLFSYVPPVHEKVGYTKEHMKKDMTKGAVTGLEDGRIAEHFVDVSYDRIIGLEKYGLKFRFEDSHLADGFRLVPQFHSIPTSLNFEGRDLKVKLTEAMKKAGVKIVNHAQVVEILNDDKGKAAGAIAISTREEKVIVVESKAVVIAVASGAGRLAQKNNLEDERFELPSVCGCGFSISLALSAGAELANLEFMFNEGVLSFYGFSNRVGSPGSSWWPAARAVDDDGNVVVHRVNDYSIDEPDYLEKNVKEYGDFMDEFNSMGKEILSGRKLYMDFNEATDEEMEYIKWSLSNEGKMWLFLRNLKRENIDLKKVKIPYKYEKKNTMHGPGAGIFVNKKCETTVKGLYAAGDSMGVTGGSGPVAVVFGYEAGLQAAEYAKGVKKESSDYEEKIQRVLNRINAIRNNEGGEPWQNIENALRGIIVAFGDLPLTDTKIKNALSLIAQLKKNPNLYGKDPHEVARSFQVLSLLESAEAIFTAAKHRDKGFGNYKRVKKYSDYREQTNSEEKTTVVYSLYRNKKGEYKFKTHDFINKNS